MPSALKADRAMARFRFTAVEPGGALVQGVLEADSEAEVISALHRRGLLPMRADPDGQSGGIADWLQRDLSFGRNLSRQDEADLFGELAVMLGAGEDLDNALRFLESHAPNQRVKAVVTPLREAVRGGASLADALGQQPESFPAIDIALVRAGEAGGRLAQALAHLAKMLGRQRALINSVRTAMIYPVLLLLASVGAIVLMLTWVLPQFVPLFEQNGAQLPKLTRVVIALGDIVSAYGMWMGLLLVVVVLALKLALRLPSMQMRADRLLLRLPLVGALSREVQAARFTRTLGTLLANGVSLVSAVAIVRDAIGNLAVRGAIEQAGQSARGGGGFSRSLANSGVFPPRTAHLLQLGEVHAQLADMALQAADIHEATVAQQLQRLLALLLPLVTVLMGIAVAAIVASLLLAMLSLNDLAN